MCGSGKENIFWIQEKVLSSKTTNAWGPLESRLRNGMKNAPRIVRKKAWDLRRNNSDEKDQPLEAVSSMFLCTSCRRKRVPQTFPEGEEPEELSKRKRFSCFSPTVAEPKRSRPTCFERSDCRGGNTITRVSRMSTRECELGYGKLSKCG